MAPKPFDVDQINPHMKCSALNADFNGVSFDPHRIKEFSVRVHQIWIPPSKRAVSATVDQSSKRTVADRHRLAAPLTSFPGVPISMTVNDLEPQK